MPITLSGFLSTLRPLLAATLLVSGLAQAADPIRGRQLYGNTPGGTTCANSSCHGTNISANRNKVQRGANNPSLIQSAINKDTGGMGIYRNNVLTATDVADIAAYIANPNATANPAASVSPASLNFAATATGSSSATQTVTLSNSGSGALSISSITVNGTDFVRSGGSCAAGGSVAAGASCSIGLLFRPQTAGSKTGSLSIAHNATGSPSSVSLSGTATTPAAASPAVSPSALSFGAIDVGSQSAAQTATVSNSGTAAMQISSLGITNPVFSFSGGSCAAGSTLAAGGGSCTVAVRFAPGSTGAASGTLNIAHNASANPLTVALSGSGATPAVPVAQLAPASLSYSQTVGSSSAAQTLTLSNSGSAALSITAITLGGAAAAEYRISAGSSCSVGASVAAGSSCNLGVVFTPSGTGARSASLSISHNDSAHSPSSAALNGNGTAVPSGQVSVNKLSLSYPAQAAGSRSASQTLSVSNSGSAPMQLSSIAINGAHAGDFAIDSALSNCNTTSSMAVGASCTLGLSFAPTVSSGSRNAALQISAGSSSATVSLSGSAAPAGQPAVTVSPASLDFGSLPLGSSANRSLSLSNSGSSTLNLSALAVSPSAYALSHNCPASLAAGASCGLTVSFTPDRSGSISGLLTLQSNAASSPDQLALSGAGVAAVGLLGWQPSAGLSYPDTAVGSASSGQAATLSNSGSASVLIQQIQLAGANSADFSPDAAGTSCSAGQSLAPGASCTLGYVFVPNAAGSRSASLNVVADAGTPPTLPLSGNGVGSGNAQLSLNPSYITLTSAPNQPLQPEALVLSNDGNAVLRITAITASAGLQALNASSPTGGSCPPPPFDLGPAQSCTVMVAALVDQAMSGTVDVYSDANPAKSSATVQGAPLTNAGAGGCSIGPPDQPQDPIWLLMLLLALAVLRYRRRQPA
ncbi:MAG: choice-of-anchor D domain-containing protein [Stagnimonas sp.]|nr:choice-of-anchor D domain-containing protein [Stagnimonas sp.]